MIPTPHWLTPELSLITEAERELDRRKAVRLDLQELQVISDRLIVDWYNHEAVIERLLRKVQELEVKLALANPRPSNPDNWQDYLDMAKELLGR